MSRKGENIFHRKDGRWEARYIKEYNNQMKPIYGYVYDKSYTLVKRKRNDILMTLSQSSKKTNKNLELCFDDLITKWLSEKKITVKTSTYSHYTEVINKHIIPYFKDIKVANINENIASEFVISRIKMGLKEKTVKDITIILNQIFKYNKINVTVKGPKIKKNNIKI